MIIIILVAVSDKDGGCSHRGCSECVGKLFHYETFLNKVSVYLVLKMGPMIQLIFKAQLFNLTAVKSAINK